MEILPITEMKDTKKVSELAEQSAVFITKNGYGHLVIQSQDSYKLEQQKLKDALLLNEAYESELELLENGGKTKSIKEVRERLNKQYGI